MYARDYSVQQLPTTVQWRFPGNQYGEIKGFNDAGVSTFGGNSMASVVRESIQNSLDAAIDYKSAPVRVEFELFKIGVSDIPGYKELKYAFERCRDFAREDERAASFFDRAIKPAGSSIRVLRISDHGTTGLRGAERGDLASDWSRLIKQSGSSAKDDLSGGSFGIGKYASFACSSMRTVFFGSMDDRGLQSSIGVARLTSFDDRGTLTSGIGYYSDNIENNAMLRPLSFPHALRRSSGDPGTDIYIMDFAEYMEPAHLTRKIEYEVLSNFLVSIWKGYLELSVNGKELNQHNLASVVGELNDEDEDERRIIVHHSLLARGTEDVKKIVLDPDVHQFAYENRYPAGSATLYLKQGQGLNRRVMITRSQGMKLFDQKHISGSIQFTGILMIEGRKMNEDFREMEVPTHDRWEPSRASNPRMAKQRYKALRGWLIDEVKEAFAQELEDQIDAFDVGLYLPAEREVETRISNRTPGDKEKDGDSLQRKKTKTRAHKLKPKERLGAQDGGGSGGRGVGAVGADPTLGDNASKDSGEKKGKKKAEKKNVDPVLDGMTYTPVRSRAMSTGTTGTYRIKLVAPRDASRFVLTTHCEGEVGVGDLPIRSAKVVRGDVHLDKIAGSRLVFGQCKRGEVVEVEIVPAFDRYCMMEVGFYATK